MGAVVPVILSGGIGSRLWPVSRREQPKQLSRLAGPISLLQMTAQRAAEIPGASSPLIVCGEPHFEAIVGQLADIGQQPCAGFLEPLGRNTAPAAAVAALSVDREDLLLVLPADHLITDVAAFVDAVAIASEAARSGYLVTFGVSPAAPETGFGYIEQGEPIDGMQRAYLVRRFVEKPDATNAAAYLAAGTYWWNSGMFMFRAGTYLEELAQFEPRMVELARAALAAGSSHTDGKGGGITLDADTFARCPANSIDYAVMERTDRAAMVPLDAGWSDVGSWAALWEVGEKDQHGNVVYGSAYLEGTTNSYVRAGDRAVAVVGMDSVVVVDTGDAVLVVNKSRSQEVKQVVERLEAEASPLAERHGET